jgi:hypothetical protein
MTYSTLQGLNNPGGGTPSYSGTNFDGSTLPPPTYSDPAMAGGFG